MSERLILSNNPLVASCFRNTVKIEGGPTKVLKESLLYLDGGFALRGHPLAGSIRLCCNPYRSVCLEAVGEGEADRNGVKAVLAAIDKVEEALSGRPVPEAALEDYAYVDFELIKRIV